jgi:two-component system, LytTR family, response regulator
MQATTECLSLPPMREIRALLVDDEAIANDGLAALLRRHSDVQVIGECRDASDAAAQIRRLAPDVVFLDVQMPGLDGFDVVRSLGPEPSPIIVFVTAHDEHALRAFDAAAVDYLLKPVADDRLDRAMHRIRRQLDGARAVNHEQRLVALHTVYNPVTPDAMVASNSSDAGVSAGVDSYLMRLTVRSGRRSVVIPVCDVDWVAADDYCVNVMVKGRKHVLRASLASLETRLDPSMFIRVHRSALVNVARVKEWHSTPLRRLILVLADNTRLRVSRSRKGRLLALLRGDSPPTVMRAPNSQ